jgi:PKD repeat protein
MLAATTVILFGAGACGGDGGGTGPNTDPDANFSGGPCTVAVACSFADLSTDPEGDATISTRSWNFGDGSAAVVNPGLTPSHTYANAGEYDVTLTVTDNGGRSNTQTTRITVTGGTPANVPPTAAFNVPTCTVNVACLFTDASTDTDGTVVGWSWNFADGTAPDLNRNPSHTFATAGTYQVSLTVTDDDGDPSSPITQSVSVNTSSPAANCITSGSDVTCELSITQPSNVTLTLTGEDCQLSGNNVVILQPYSQNAFFNTCSLTPGAQYTIRDAAGAPRVISVGVLRIRMHQGTAGAGSPAPGAPAARVEGTYPNWTISIDDGGNPGGPGEPDFTDVVLSVQATAAQ